MTHFINQPIRQNISTALTFAARIAFAFTVVLIPVRYRFILLKQSIPPVYADYTNLLLFIADIFMLATLALWGVSFLFSPHKITSGPRHVWIPLVGLTAAGWISVITSFNQLLSIYHSIRLIALFAFYLFVVNEIHSANWVIIPVGLQAVTEAVVAIAQFIAQRSVDLQRFGELVLDPAWAGISIVVANGIRLLRAYGLSDHPNILGGCLAFALLILLAAYFRQSKRATALIFFLPALPALLVTFSRSAWLAFFAGAAFIVPAEMIYRGKKTIRHLLWLTLISIILLAPFILAYARFFGVRFGAGDSFNTPTVEQQSLGERVLLINYAAPIFLQHPLTGIGLGVSPLAFKSYYPHFPVAYEPPHFALFDAALETGALGAVFYLLLIILPFVIFFKQRQPLLSSPWTVAAAALWVAVTVVGFFDYYTWMLVAGRLWLYLALGLWAIALDKIPHPARTQNGSPFKELI
ncbi:MAG: O-antigen ligase family protein [Chloroflexi bacterium]|nr:O-antigen ligase family protein [Chloroflexota bacterium]